MSTQEQRLVVHYRGRVQGVGFRATVREIAWRFTVTGYVKNLRDGRVLLVAEGSPDELEQFTAAIAEQMGRLIVEALCDVQPANGEFTEFSIQH